MKAKKLLVGVVSLFALTACGEVEPAQFKEEFSKIEEHTYSSATVKYSYDTDFILKSKGEGTIDYKFENGKWTTSSSDEKASEYMDLLTPVKSSDAALATIDTEGYDSKVEVKYYVNPFKIKATYEETTDKDGTKGSVKLEAISQFDKYGYLTVTSLDLRIKAASKDTTLETYMKYNVKISYKD